MSNIEPSKDIVTWLECFADTYIDGHKAPREGFLDSKLFGPPIAAIYLRENARDNFGADPVGWVTFEATVHDGKVFKTDRVIRPR
jgi:hypothetical protein